MDSIFNPPLSDTDEITDLRSAIARLEKLPGQIRSTHHPVDPHAELAGVYKRIGAGGTVMRPTQKGPAMIFETVKGYPGARVLVGLMADRKRVAHLLDSKPEDLGRRMGAAVDNAIAPVEIEGAAPCQEQVFRADDPSFDLRRLLPAPTNTEQDAGPYFCLGLLLGSDPDEGHTDVTIHRLCVQGRDELSVFFAPGRHIDAFREKAEARGQALPITINMGLDPAILIGACFEAPTTPFGFDELAVAGGLRGRPVELVRAKTVDQRAIARAEIVIEGEILPNVRVKEDQNTGTGHAMPEFPGYDGPANPSLPVIKVKAVTMRHNAILQTLVGPGEEHTSLAGIPTEASIYNACERALPGFVKNVYAHTAGGGKLLAVIQVCQRSAGDQGKARQAAIIALGVYREVKNVIIVDDDVDLFDSDDVLWAMQTRYQGDVDTIFLPNVTGHVLDPSQSPEYNAAIPAKGISCKTIFDCTYPWKMRKHFERAPFRDVDPTPFAPDLFPKA
ncbi:UbiD family decarboxylase [Acidisoma cellulosilytica]|uniref:UbiD family decarboxylase n=1 Tax=Acidisoma cellulosilyticum TaxID=2802395 RepID=A0A963Z5U6_9PROT|nr:UbiD family decarboxylase [Acidisoma cellulosilyticum]MCB8883399.1 UbiD family decarboxylase [Acidisoma cellulosilyticum]